MAQRLPRARRSLGQNFLVSPGVVERILDAVAAPPALPVFEIGPGTGALTLPLAARGALVAAFEIDRALAGRLEAELGKNPRAEVVNADYRGIDLDAEAAARGWTGYVLAGNIPYLLTSTILLGLPGLARCRRAVIMVQREVGERVLAPPGSRRCGILSVYLQAYLAVSRVMNVGAGSFRPRPKVDSVVLRFEPTAREGAPRDRGAFLALLKGAFAQRRKKLGNALAAAYGPEAATALAAGSGVDAGRRPEELTLEEWFALAEAAPAGGTLSDGKR
ncbi:MAG: 16S rRNA (adenine(1518)-N(6)/adenine(1519)-N(6))-dimethyltransferase RsmA [Candidatus Krumholzibacteria bacterium]|nr:16S rRNA (adenine(1518)-N(6)/adenine(1519)-N(6))-dimethyltransferase RsmA [Candidatus Krumholzibacteria bacterium]